MFKFLPKIIPGLFFWGIFGYVIFQVDYPKSITQASFLTLLSFFIPLFLSLIFTINILLKNMLATIFISLGVVFLLLLKALDILNLVSFTLTVIAVWLLLSYFKRGRRNNRLTSSFKIPKLSMKRRER